MKFRAASWLVPPRGVPVRAPAHPGRLLARTCLVPLSLNQSEAARLLGLSRRRLHELVHGQRAMSPDTALRCARQFGIDASFWLAQQAAWDSFQAWKRLRASSTAPSFPC
ncbi:MAG: HigA family addiction module antitoxin [Pseudomonadota bacterium]